MRQYNDKTMSAYFRFRRPAAYFRSRRPTGNGICMILCHKFYTYENYFSGRAGNQYAFSQGLDTRKIGSRSSPI
jgi:hypothetical protein